MFVINKSLSYKWPVTIKIPVDGGRYEEHTFDVQFRRLSQQEIRSAISGDSPADDDFVRKVVTGWSGITDENGDLPFSDTALARVMDIPGVSAAIITAFFESVSGVVRKN